MLFSGTSFSTKFSIFSEMSKIMTRPMMTSSITAKVSRNFDIM